MKSSFFFSMILAGVAVLTSVNVFAADDPVFKMFPMNITFHASFNDEVKANMANGSEMPLKKNGTYTYGKGVFGGKSLQGCSVSYAAEGNLDFTLPGTIICWISAVDWPDGAKKQPGYYTFFTADAPDYQFIMGKMPGAPERSRHMNCYFRMPDGAHSCILFDSARFQKNGEWKMVAATWNANSISSMVNEQVVAAKKPVLQKNVTRFAIGIFTDKGFVMAVDEVTILDRQLTVDELKKYYETCVKLIGENGKSAPKAQ